LLLEACLSSGTHGPVTLIERKWAGPDTAVETLKIKMEDVVVAEVGLGGSGDQTGESVTLNFRKVTTTYTPQNADGTAGTPVIERVFERTG
jgi:type VI protein secretion system component Hcp